MQVFLFNRGKYPGRLPSTSDAFKLHIRRARYQTTICCFFFFFFFVGSSSPFTQDNYMVECYSSVPEHIDPETCRLVRDPYSNQLKPKLLLLEPIPKVCTQLLQCCCKVCATRRCKWRSNNADCLPACGCGSITCGNPLNVVEEADTEGEL